MLTKRLPDNSLQSISINRPLCPLLGYSQSQTRRRRPRRFSTRSIQWVSWQCKNSPVTIAYTAVVTAKHSGKLMLLIQPRRLRKRIVLRICLHSAIQEFPAKSIARNHDIIPRALLLMGFTTRNVDSLQAMMSVGCPARA